MVSQANSILNKLDNILLSNLSEQSFGLLNGLGGCALYFSQRYKQTNTISYHNISIEILERIIKAANENSSYNGNIDAPNIACCWLIDQFIKDDQLNEDEKINPGSVEDLIIGTMPVNELDQNCHDLFYGFIGRALILIENDFSRNKPHVDNILHFLKKNAVHDKDGLFWKTVSPVWLAGGVEYQETLNFGIPHGNLGIILFLLKCHVVYEDSDLGRIITDAVHWLIKKLNIENNKLPYQYAGDRISGTGKLGWCYGDLSIAFTLLRYSEVFNDQSSKTKAYELIHQASSKSLHETGIKYFPEYDFYDVGVCHGCSSVAYMYKKIARITNDKKLQLLADKWLLITMENLNKFLFQIETIRKKQVDAIDTSVGFLEGLSGVGLVLSSSTTSSPGSWDKLLLLDRPEKN